MGFNPIANRYKRSFCSVCPVLHRTALPVASQWCRYRPSRIHLGSRPSCNARYLAVGFGAISLSDKIAANNAGPYMQDFLGTNFAE